MKEQVVDPSRVVAYREELQRLYFEYLALGSIPNVQVADEWRQKFKQMKSFAKELGLDFDVELLGVRQKWNEEHNHG